MSKYYYNNELLIDYCKKNNINYTTIVERVNKLKKEYPKKGNNEIIEMALDNNRKCKFYYKDKTLSSYCNDPKKYTTVYRRLIKLIDKYDNVSIDDLTMVALKEKTIEEVLSENDYIDKNIKKNKVLKK